LRYQSFTTSDLQATGSSGETNNIPICQIGSVISRLDYVVVYLDSYFIGFVAFQREPNKSFGRRILTSIPRIATISRTVILVISPE